SVFAFDHRLGYILVAGPGFILRRDPDTMVSPDLSFVATDRLPPPGQRVGPWPIAPDLAVEVVSPSDRSCLVSAKVSAHLDAGCRLVWVVEPRRRTVTAWMSDRLSQVFREDETLDGGDVMPGYTVTVSQIFESTW
ncbi:MAG: Uma2 family endonuclease, partial [Chloroflexia bacterium]|nr:Uma2 family endonuclease [Chloroflexia bacterium]